jgi:hypothetical protein
MRRLLTTSSEPALCFGRRCRLLGLNQLRQLAPALVAQPGAARLDCFCGRGGDPQRASDISQNDAAIAQLQIERGSVITREGRRQGLTRYAYQLSSGAARRRLGGRPKSPGSQALARTTSPLPPSLHPDLDILGHRCRKLLRRELTTRRLKRGTLTSRVIPGRTIARQ